jgi:hypothetical protein
MNLAMTVSRVRYYRAMFYSGAIYNFSVAISLVLAFENFYPLLGGGDIPQSPLFSLFLQITMGLVFLFGVIYGLIGYRPEAESSGILASLGIAAKLLFFFIMSGYAAAELIPWGLAALTFVDLFYSLLFIEYMLYRSSVAKQERSP